jgi:hypothetical protein
MSENYSKMSKADLIKLVNGNNTKSQTAITKDENGAFQSVIADSEAGFRGTSLNIAVSKNGVVRANTNRVRGGTCVIATDMDALKELCKNMISLAQKLTKDFVPQPAKKAD